MADEKVNMGPEENKPPETLSPPGQGNLPPLEENNAPAVSGEDKAAPDHVEPDPPSADKHTQRTVLPGMGEDTPAPSGKVINLSDIQAADKGGKEASTTAPEKKAPEADQPKKRRGRPPKEQAAVSAGKKEKAAEPRTGRPSKVDKAAREEAPPAVRDKVSRGKKADKGKETGSGGAPVSKTAQAVKPGKAAPVKEAAVPPPEINLPPTPDVPPRPVEEGKIVYLKMAELHPFHTFREHPYKVQDDKAMDDLVGTIKEHGIMTPATVRPEKDGKGYEIIAGHRRHHGGTRAGLEEMPCIVREMTDLEAVREMRNSNKQRGDPLPSELAKLLDLEVEAIKRQGARPKNEKEAEALGKLSVEIVGKEHDMNYKKVMRYIRLNSLVPELLDKVDTKQMGFMPAVEISYIRPENQRLIAVSIDGEQSSPSVAQAKRLHELDKEGKLNGDVIDGILSEEKKEDRGVIISTAELSKYFGKEVTPAKMKEQIMALLDEWKEKQPPELAQPDRKKDLEK
jgi:ParB family chromosome partitioning protein